MSYFNPTRTEAAVLACENCGTTRGPIERVHTDDGQRLRLCEECADTERGMERRANDLAALPSCDARQKLIDQAETTRGLVNALTDHDMGCPCAKPKPADRSVRTLDQREVA